MYSVILHCPELQRDISALQQAVPGVKVYESQRMRSGAEACMRGHQAIVAEAWALREPCVFVMEDDCQFTEHFDAGRWQDAVDWTQDHGYDVLVGGTTRTYDERVVFVQRDPYRVDEADDGWEIYEASPLSALIEVSAFHSAHCVVYLESAYPKVLRATVPIDWTIGRDCGARCLVRWPFVAVQRSGYSGIEEAHVNYVPLYQLHERTLEQQVKATRGVA